MAGGEGSDASGPSSVRWGRKAHTTKSDPKEASARNGEAGVLQGVNDATMPIIAVDGGDERGEAADRLSISDVLDDDNARQGVPHVVECAVEEDESINSGGEGAVMIARRERLARWRSNPKINGRGGGGVNGVGINGGGEEATGGPSREEGGPEKTRALGGKDVLPATREEYIEGGGADVGAGERTGVPHARQTGEKNIETEVTEDGDKAGRMDGTTKRGDGARGCEETGGEHSPKRTRLGNGVRPTALVHREEAAGGDEVIMVGGIGEGGGENEGVGERGMKTTEEARAGESGLSAETANGTLHANHAVGSEGRKTPGSEVTQSATTKGRVAAAAQVGMVKPGVEGGGREARCERKMERNQRARPPSTALHDNAHMVGMEMRMSLARRGSGMMGEDGMGEGSGGGTARGVQEGDEALEETRIGKATMQHASTTTHDRESIKSKQSQSSCSDGPTWSGTWPARRGEGSRSEIARAATTEESTREATGSKSTNKQRHKSFTENKK